MSSFICAVFLVLCASQPQLDGVEPIVGYEPVRELDEVVPLEVVNSAVKKNAWVYRDLLRRNVIKEFGNDNFLSVIAGLAMQEALWDCFRSSKYADGCMQFTPQTAKWAAATFCRDLGQPHPERPSWAYPCGIRYLSWLFDRIKVYGTVCDRLAFTTKSYNGGLGNVKKEQKLVLRLGGDPGDWRQVDKVIVRAKWADKENDAYPIKILLKWAPEYIKVNYGGKDICANYQFT